MDHLYLFGIVINLITGTGVIVYFFQIARSFPYPFLKPMAWHLILFNIALAILLLYEYFEVNVQGFAESPQITLYHDLGYLLACCLLNGIVFVMARIYSTFLYSKFSLFFVYAFVAGFVLIIASYIFKEVTVNQSAKSSWKEVFFYSIQLLFFLAEITLLILLMVNGSKRSKEWRKIINAYALISMSHYVVLTVVIIFPIPIIVAGSYLYFNISPLFWLLYFFLKFARTLANQAESSGILELISDKYQVSDRERDIIRLILKGKSNSEIKDELFISYHTVKNHLYSLYNKLGITSRYELILFFNRHFSDNLELKQH